MFRKGAFVLQVSLIALIVCPLCVARELSDVSFDAYYQELARQHIPTLLHQSGQRFLPVNPCFDSDWDASNNRAAYDYLTSEGYEIDAWVGIHILRDSRYGTTYIQYWFYYVYNDYVNIHNDDWELVVVKLDGSCQPLRVFVGAHGGLDSSAWANVEKAITPYHNPNLHPVVFVDAGSHAGHLSRSLLWLDGQYTTWEDLSDGYTFLGDWGETHELPGVSVVEFEGLFVPFWRYDGTDSGTSSSLDTLHSTVGVALPSAYGQPENFPHVDIVAPWKRPIWRFMDDNTRSY